MDLILYNPKSKNSKANVQTHKLIRKYKKKNIPFRLKSILKIKDLSTFIKENPQYKKIILLGGDGTIHRMVNNLAKDDLKIPIYIKKNGSGNDFLRSLKQNDQTPQNIMQVSLDETHKHYFINGTGIGLDGLIIDYVDHAKNKGKLTYFLCSLRAILNYVPEDINVTIDGENHQFKDAYLVAVNNGKFIGGGMQVTPHANISDDLLDVLIVHRIKKLFILLIFSTIYLGIHTKFKRWVYSTKCKHIKVSFQSPQISQSDGERTDDVQTLEATASDHTIQLKAY